MPQTFDEMATHGVQPNNYVVSALFAAASFVPCTPEQVERLFAALALLRRWAAVPEGRRRHALLCLDPPGCMPRALCPCRGCPLFTSLF